MTEQAIDQLIVTAMQKVCGSVWKNVCRASPLPDEFIVHDAEDDKVELYEGDDDTAVTYYRRVHLYTKWNPGDKPKRMRQEARKSGFTITGATELDEKDGYTHKIISMYIQETVDE